MQLEALRKDMVAAMKAKDKERKEAISSLVSAVKKAAIDAGCRDDIPESMVDQVILKELKTAKEQIDTCPDSRQDLKAEYQFRYDVIKEYAPAQMSAEEVKAYIQEKFAEVVATKNKGMIMKNVMADMKGKADGKVINQVVAEQGMPYAEQLRHKEKRVRILLDSFGKVHPIIGMKDPYHYRNKVHAVFDRDRRGNAISGVYQKGTHKVVPVDSCMIEDQKADEIIVTIRGLLKSFKIKTYDEDTQYGLLRHVLIRRGFSTGEIMVVLVTASPVFPSKNNFVKALRKVHPEITTVVQNINDRGTSMVLGTRDVVLYGK